MEIYEFCFLLLFYFVGCQGWGLSVYICWEMEKIKLSGLHVIPVCGAQPFEIWGTGEVLGKARFLDLSVTSKWGQHKAYWTISKGTWALMQEQDDKYAVLLSNMTVTVQSGIVSSTVQPQLRTSSLWEPRQVIHSSWEVSSHNPHPVYLTELSEGLMGTVSITLGKYKNVTWPL